MIRTSALQRVVTSSPGRRLPLAVAVLVLLLTLAAVGSAPEPVPAGAGWSFLEPGPFCGRSGMPTSLCEERVVIAMHRP